MTDNLFVAEEVSAAFEILLKAIEDFTEKLKSNAITFINTGDTVGIRIGADHLDSIKEFHQRTQELSSEWADEIKKYHVTTRRPNRIKSTPTKNKIIRSPKTNLEITFSDGFKIHEKSAIDGMLKTMERIGLDKIEKLGIVIESNPLVSKDYNKFKNYEPKKLGLWYVHTHSSTVEKQKLLLDISNHPDISIPLTIKVIKPT